MSEERRECERHRGVELNYNCYNCGAPVCCPECCREAADQIKIHALEKELAELKAQREVLAERWVIIRQKGDSWHGDFLLKDRLCETQSEAWRILGPHNVEDRKGILENDWRAIRVALIKREEV